MLLYPITAIVFSKGYYGFFSSLFDFPSYFIHLFEAKLATLYELRNIN